MGMRGEQWSEGSGAGEVEKMEEKAKNDDSCLIFREWGDQLQLQRGSAKLIENA